LRHLRKEPSLNSRVLWMLSRQRTIALELTTASVAAAPRESVAARAWNGAGAEALGARRIPLAAFSTHGPRNGRSASAAGFHVRWVLDLISGAADDDPSVHRHLGQRRRDARAVLPVDSTCHASNVVRNPPGLSPADSALVGGALWTFPWGSRRRFAGLDPILRRLRHTGSRQLCVEPLRHSQVLEYDGQRL
jgi:hypothetical protein